ncbi:MAG: hypothetical protein HY077_11460 [Elusimicrobia bacterium]|nr:hypothetical protein [Elusimicrobiota bacterium]
MGRSSTIALALVALLTCAPARADDEKQSSKSAKSDLKTNKDSNSVEKSKTAAEKTLKDLNDPQDKFINELQKEKSADSGFGGGSNSESLGPAGPAAMSASKAGKTEGSARPAAVGVPPSSDGPPTESGLRGERAFGRASTAANALRNQLHGPEALGSGGGDLGGATASRAAASAEPPAGRAPPELANPKTTQDLALASVSGFGGAFSALGLKIGAGPAGQAAILRRDGRPASPSEVETLKTAIASEPAALMRRPDYFSVLKRERFRELKVDYVALPALAATAFKDVSMPETKRDFLWSASCSRVSGDCNPAALETSYTRGDYVPPEDLDRMWQRIKSDPPADDAYSAEDKLAAEEADRNAELLGKSVLARGRSGGFMDRLKGLAGMVGSFFDGSGASGTLAASAGLFAYRAAGGAARAAPGIMGGKAAPPGARPGVPAPAPASQRPTPLWAAAGLLGAALLAAWLLRRRGA